MLSAPILPRTSSRRIYSHGAKSTSMELLDAKIWECRSREKRLQECWTSGYHKAMLLLNILQLKYYLEHRTSCTNNPLSNKIRMVFIITFTLSLSHRLLWHRTHHRRPQPISLRRLAFTSLSVWSSPLCLHVNSGLQVFVVSGGF